MMTFRELDALGEGLVRDYIGRSGRRDCVSVDIEGFIEDYLGLRLVYERFAGEDECAIGFCADGNTPLKVWRDGQPAEIVFPVKTLVIESCLRRSEESGRRRFTMAHEAAHSILKRHAPLRIGEAVFHRDWDAGADWRPEELRRLLSWNEALANRLAAALLMPSFLTEQALRRHWEEEKVPCFGGIWPPEAKLAIRKTADDLGVSLTACTIRLRELGLTEDRPVAEYLAGCPGGSL